MSKSRFPGAPDMGKVTEITPKRVPASGVSAVPVKENTKKMSKSGVSAVHDKGITTISQIGIPFYESNLDQAVPEDLRLGPLMVRAGMLSSTEAETVSILIPQYNLPFGELAIKLGLSKPEDVQAVLEQQKSYTEFPAYQVKEHQKVMSVIDPAGCNVDQLRAIRGQLQLGWFNQQKTLLLAGPMGGEGTSMIAAGLACMFAELNWRTLLIDANLRAPRQHALFELNNHLGLSNMLGKNPDELHPQSLPQVANLSVITTGPVPSNPSELISNDTLSRILNIGVAHYDVVLIDGPCSTSPEFLVLAALSGGVMIVVQKGTTRLDAVREIKERIQRAGAQVVGAVLNDH